MTVPARSPARRVGYALVAVVVGLLGVEGAARVAERLWPAVPEPAPGVPDPAWTARAASLRAEAEAGFPLVADEARTWALPPNRVVEHAGMSVRLNAWGMRGPDLGPPAPGEARLVTVGDSSVFGIGVPEARIYATVAAEALAARLGRPVVPANLGAPGYDSGQSRRQLASIGPLLHPTWIVVANLWSDVYRAPPPAAAPRALAAWRVGARLLAPWLSPTRVGWVEDPADVGGEGERRVALPTYRANLADMARQARRLGATPAFLVLPAPIDLADQVPDTVLAYRAAMAEVAAAERAVLVDGPAYFAAHAATEGMFLDQVHPGVAGHALLGAAVAEALVDVPPARVSPPAGAPGVGPAGDAGLPRRDTSGS